MLRQWFGQRLLPVFSTPSSTFPLSNRSPAEAPFYSLVRLSGKPPDIVQAWVRVWHEQFQISPWRRGCSDWDSPSCHEVGTWAQCCKSAVPCSEGVIGLSIKGTCALDWLCCAVLSMFWLSLLKRTYGKELCLHRLVRTIVQYRGWDVSCTLSQASSSPPEQPFHVHLCVRTNTLWLIHNTWNF